MVPTDPIACVSFWYYFKSESAKLTVSISKGIEGTHSQQQGLEDYDIFRLYAEKNNGWKNAKVEYIQYQRLEIANCNWLSNVNGLS